MTDLVPTTATPGVSTIKPRLPELGRLRAGAQKTDPRRPGTPLQTWRVTSNDEYALRAIASTYGGEVTEWADGEQRYQVVTEAESLPVRLPPNPVSVFYERWGGGGLQRRCDGNDCVVITVKGEGKARTSETVEQKCWCIGHGLVPHEDANKGACALTTRLRVILEDAPGLGHYLLTTHSLIAAMELPAQAELLAAMTGAGTYVPAELAIDPRSHKRPDEPYKREYLIPTLRIRKTPRQLEALKEELTAGRPPTQSAVGNGNGPKAIEAREVKALETVVASGKGEAVDNRALARQFDARRREAGLSDREAEVLVQKATKGRSANLLKVQPGEWEILWDELAAHLAAAKAEQAESAGRPF